MSGPVGSTLDETDRRLIQATQSGLPLVAQPYDTVGAGLGLSGAEVMARLERMRGLGVIRRIAAIPNHYRLGYTANAMTVWEVNDDDADAVGRRLAEWPGVSHCYRRPRHLPLWPYSIFAMLHGRDRVTVEAEVAAIAEALGPLSSSHQVLFSTRILKKTGLRLVELPVGG
ncbi:MAG: Lrp/AsnC family transcriptional regulator [Rhodospirillaceae bacterium]